MHRFLKAGTFLSFTFIALLIPGCATTAKYKEKLDTWNGKNVNQLIDVWGFPDKIIKSPTKNKVYVYKFKSSGRYPRAYIPGNTTVINNNGNSYVNASPGYYTGGGSYSNNCTTWFELNKQNKIIRAVFRGNDCVST